MTTLPRKRTAPVRRKKRTRQRARSYQKKHWKRVFTSILATVVFLAAFYYLFVRSHFNSWRYETADNLYGISMPAGFTVCGIDISRYQKEIDWAEMVDKRDSINPIYFVFIKATEGASHVDPLFHRNFRDAHRYGFLRGAYHFFTPFVSVNEQVHNFTKNVHLVSGDLPPVLDVEVRGNLPIEELQSRTLQWLLSVEQHYKVRPIIYASWKFKEEYLNTAAFERYPFWIAHYYVPRVSYQGEWHFWQHTDVASVPGIETPVDMNIFNGTREQLAALTIP